MSLSSSNEKASALHLTARFDATLKGLIKGGDSTYITSVGLRAVRVSTFGIENDEQHNQKRFSKNEIW